ncbi:MAG: peptidylprolyl isomerase [Gammaproteobacteria bacterium]|nr:peptidylprolyl isomerase [Gammaproteobacteria bacterium]
MRYVSKTIRSVFATALSALTLSGCVSASDEALPVVVLSTELGDIEIEVDIDRAPQSSMSFLDFVDAGLYEGATFYRTVMPENDKGSPPISVIQGGLADESNSMPPVPHETTQDSGVLHTDGVISLARAAPGEANAAAFFICIGDQPGLDFGGKRNPDGLGFAAFGKVVGGMDVVRAIHEREALGPSESDYTKGQMITEPVVINSAARK